MSSPPTGRVAIGLSRIFAKVGIQGRIQGPTHGGTPTAEGFTVSGSQITGFVDAWGNVYSQPYGLTSSLCKIDSAQVQGGRDAIVNDQSGTSGLAFLWSTTGGPVGTGDYYLFAYVRFPALNTTAEGFDCGPMMGMANAQDVGIGTRNTGELSVGSQQSSNVMAVADLSAGHFIEVNRISNIRSVFFDGIWYADSTDTVNLAGGWGLSDSLVNYANGQKYAVWDTMVAQKSMSYAERDVLLRRLSEAYAYTIPTRIIWMGDSNVAGHIAPNLGIPWVGTNTSFAELTVAALQASGVSVQMPAIGSTTSSGQGWVYGLSHYATSRSWSGSPLAPLNAVFIMFGTNDITGIDPATIVADAGDPTIITAAQQTAAQTIYDNAVSMVTLIRTNYSRVCLGLVLPIPGTSQAFQNVRLAYNILARAGKAGADIIVDWDLVPMVPSDLGDTIHLTNAGDAKAAAFVVSVFTSTNFLV